MQIVKQVYRKLGVRVALHINNRKVLSGIAEVIGEPDKMTDITVAIDKLDKIGVDKVNEELSERGLSSRAIAALQPILNLNGNNKEKLEQLEGVLPSSEIGMKGIEELRTILDMYEEQERAGEDQQRGNMEVVLDLCLARGLNYYTGAIFRSKGAGRTDGEHHRRRALRQPDGYIRLAGCQWSRHIIRCRPYL